MPKISRIALDQNITDGDRLLGTDESGNTKNFKLSNLSNFFAEEAGNHKHTQDTELAEWDITHNLELPNFLPLVNIKIKDGTYNNVQALGIVTYVNENRLRINFSSPQKGYAYIKK